MEQRRLRLGDTLDDYCPRERRVTNHAVVAMIEEDVKQTRCTTCDAEHIYKGGREPRRRTKTAPGALYREVLAGMTEGEYAVATVGADIPVPQLNMADDPEINPEMINEEIINDVASELGAQGPDGSDDVEGPESTDSTDSDDALAAGPVEEGPVHRPLIRATLPRPEGQKEVRQVTDFTVRHSNGQFRVDRAQPRGPGAGNGGRPAGRRFPGSNPGLPGRGPAPSRGGGGFRGANGPQRQGPKKRSR